MPHESLQGVEYLFAFRHLRADPQSDTIERVEILHGDAMAERIIQMIPELARDNPRKVLIVTSAARRSRQSARALATRLKVEPVEVGFLISDGIMLAPQIAELIRKEVKSETRVIIIFGHDPQIRRLPKELVPNVCRMLVDFLLPGEGVCVNIRRATIVPLRQLRLTAGSGDEPLASTD